MLQTLTIDREHQRFGDLCRFTFAANIWSLLAGIQGFKKNEFLNEGERHVQYFNRHFGFVLRPARAGSPEHVPLSPGLHHFCFRVEDTATVDAISEAFARDAIECSEPHLYPEYAPDYYAIFFTDPNGIRLEVTNYRQERRRRFADWRNVH